jgi:hypothetical protein
MARRCREARGRRRHGRSGEVGGGRAVVQAAAWAVAEAGACGAAQFAGE